MLSLLHIITSVFPIGVYKTPNINFLPRFLLPHYASFLCFLSTFSDNEFISVYHFPWHPVFPFVISSSILMDKYGLDADPWCSPTFTSNSSDFAASVLSPSYISRTISLASRYTFLVQGEVYKLSCTGWSILNHLLSLYPQRCSTFHCHWAFLPCFPCFSSFSCPTLPNPWTRCVLYFITILSSLCNQCYKLPFSTFPLQPLFYPHFCSLSTFLGTPHHRMVGTGSSSLSKALFLFCHCLLYI